MTSSASSASASSSSFDLDTCYRYWRFRAQVVLPVSRVPMGGSPASASASALASVRTISALSKSRLQNNRGV